MNQEELIQNLEDRLNFCSQQSNTPIQSRIFGIGDSICIMRSITSPSMMRNILKEFDENIWFSNLDGISGVLVLEA